MFLKVFKKQLLSFNKLLALTPFLPEVLVIILLALMAILIDQRMIRDGIIFESNDIKYHITWLQHFSKQFSEGILYPKWLAGDNYGYGSPTFVFYPPLVYYLGSILKLSGFNIEQTIIILFALAIFLTGFSFYLCGRKRWGKIASLAGALFYMSTPYIALNIYFRGALAEIWALIWIPLGFWITNKAMVQSRWRIVLALVAALVALTHVPSLLIFTISWLLYSLSFLFIQSWKAVVKTIGSAFLGFGLVSFYLFPAIWEKSLVNIDYMRFEDGYKRNFISFGLTDTINIVHKFIEPIFIYNFLIILLLLGIVFIARKNKTQIKQTGSWLFFLLILIFFMTYPSVIIWQTSKTLQMVQFPWRLLGLFSFAIGAIYAIAVSIITKTNQYFKNILILIIIVILLGNIFYSYKLSLSLPGFHNPGNIAAAREKGSWKASIYDQIKTVLYDPYTDKLRGTNEYRPLLNNGQAASAPLIGQPPVFLESGKAKIDLELWDSYKRIIKVVAQETSTIKLRTYYYPAWHLYVNNQPHTIDVDNDGTIKVKLEAGIHNLELCYESTLASTAGSILSVLSLIILILLSIERKLTKTIVFKKSYF